MCIVVAVPVALKYSRNFAGRIVVVETLWVLDVFVIGNAAILSDLLVES